MSKRLSDDVSISELMEFRNEGYTNKQIAEMLDASPMTIYRYIGKMPDDMIKAARIDGIKKSHESRFQNKEEIMIEQKYQTMTEPKNACLAVQNHVVRLKGVVGCYEIDCKEKMVGIDFSGIVGFDALDDFIAELQTIRSNVGQINVMNEMW